MKSKWVAAFKSINGGKQEPRYASRVKGRQQLAKLGKHE